MSDVQFKFSVDDPVYVGRHVNAPKQINAFGRRISNEWNVVGVVVGRHEFRRKGGAVVPAYTVEVKGLPKPLRHVFEQRLSARNLG